MTEGKDFVSVAVAARLLGVSVPWLRDNGVKIGLAVHRTIGQHRRYRLRDVRDVARRIATEKKQEADELQELWK